jgi:uncharacterized protein YqeY
MFMALRVPRSAGVQLDAAVQSRERAMYTGWGDSTSRALCPAWVTGKRYHPGMESEIRKRLDNDLKEAMRAKDTLRTEVVRNVRGTMRAKEIDSGVELSDDELQKLIRSLVKQREDSITQYEQGGRADLVERERAEKALLESYLPAAASAADIERAVGEVIAELGAITIKDMGKVMKAVQAKLGASADGKLISTFVKQKLTP